MQSGIGYVAPPSGSRDAATLPSCSFPRNLGGRPKGTKQPADAVARSAAACRARWQNPEYRARWLARLAEIRPQALEALRVAAKTEAYRAKIREAARKRPDILPEMTPEQKRFYVKLKRWHRYTRAEALAFVFSP